MSKIAILGATSQLARDYVSLAAATANPPELLLYARAPERVQAFLDVHGLRYPVYNLNSFGEQTCSTVINFIGVGDPARAMAMGAGIFTATEESDQLALAYLKTHPATRYIFLSSGAAYGNSFARPVIDDSSATILLNNIKPHDYYGIAKLYAEVRHRALIDFSIIDLRIFSYVSRSMDLNSRFLITDIINSIRKNCVFKTDNQDIYRDYLNPDDFSRLLQVCIDAPLGTNIAIDAFSQAPIGKLEMLKMLVTAFGLQVEMTTNLDTSLSTSQKTHYYSQSRKAAALGYQPCYTSHDAIVSELNHII